jgi:hypothetical protein
MTLDASQFVDATERARAACSKTVGAFKTVALGLSGLGAAFAAFRSVEGIVSGVMNQFENGRQLMELSRATQTNVRDLVVLQQAFRNAGASADSVGHAIFMLQKSLGGINEAGEPTAHAFGQIGLSIASLKKLDTVSQFQAIAQGIEKIKDPSRQSAAAMGIFGRSAMEVMGLLRDPQAFSAAVKEMGPMADVMARNAEQFEKVSKSMELMKLKVQSIFTGIAAGVAPALQGVLDLVNKIDFTKWGVEIGNVISVLTQAFKDGKLKDIVTLSLTIAFKNAVNDFAGMMQAVMQGLGAGIGAFFTQDFFDGLKSGFIGVAEAFGAALIENLSGLINDLISAANYIPARNNAVHALEGDARNINEARAASKDADYAYNRINNPDSSPAQIEQAKQTAIAGHLALAKAAKQASDDLGLVSLSMKEYIAAHHNDSIQLGGLDANGLRGKSATDLGVATTKIKASMGVFGQSLVDIAKTMKKVSVFDTTADQASLGKLVASLPQPAQPGSAVSPGAAGASVNERSLSYKMPDSDRLAKVGLFIGGSPATPGLTEAKRTAAATERMSKSMDSLLAVQKSSSHSMTALFAE